MNRFTKHSLLSYFWFSVVIFSAISCASHSQTVSSTDVQIPLLFKKGWNLFSVPNAPAEFSIDTFFEGKAIGTLWKFANGRYRKSQEMEPRVGYWVYLGDDLSKVFIIPHNPQDGNSLKTVESGWNLLGVYSPVQIPPQRSGIVWHYKNGRYHPTNDDLLAGQSYWINFATADDVDLGSLARDFDTDEIPDYWEQLWNFQYQSAEDKLADFDEDDLENLREFEFGSNPKAKDTDNDGLEDGIEVKTHLTSPVSADTDRDGLIDGEEVNIYKSNPVLFDTDDDGMPDGWEIRHELNPLSDVDKDDDPDADNVSNIEEFKNGLNPRISNILVEGSPPAPTVSSPARITNQNQITLTGITGPNRSITIDGGSEPSGAEVDAIGAFSSNVGLQPNKLNRLAVISVGTDGSPSAPQFVDIIQDSQPPTLFIDFPADNSELTDDTITIAGRVADTLSGFMGLQVEVINETSESEPQAANVIVGIGTNGTFERSGVPLEPGSNTIMVMAKDELGNRVKKKITVRRVSLSGPKVLALSGDNQTGQVQTRLANPVVVKISNPDDSPFANKIVTFTVSRSDGRITTDPESQDPGVRMLQLPTDANGEAKVYWTLGTDAGCGNNRLTVNSTGISGTVFFCASANPAPAKQINIGSGNNQRCEAGGPSLEPLKVWVSDSCNGVEGIPVTLTVIQGGGKVNGQDSITIDTSRTGHAQVNFQLGPDSGNNVIEANFPGNTANPTTFTLYGVRRDPELLTTFSGLVLDNANQPIGGATCFIQVGQTKTDEVMTDDQGQFAFQDVPAGAAHVHVDGATATKLNGQDIPDHSFPSLMYETTIIPNAKNTLATPVLLPPLNPNNLHRDYDGTADLILTCEGMEGLKMTIKAGSMRKADGSLVTPDNPVTVSLNQVHHDDIPMPMPDGASPPFAWTLQPAGATFDPPIQIEYPNMSGLPAGSIAYFLSFNHDTSRFEIVASGHVVEDGSIIINDAGVGLSVSGWGGRFDSDVTGDVEGDGTCGDDDNGDAELWITGDKFMCIDGMKRLAASGGTGPYKWESRDPSIATVSQDGIVQGIAPGMTLISVEDQNGHQDIMNVGVVKVEFNPHDDKSKYNGYDKYDPKIHQGTEPYDFLSLGIPRKDETFRTAKCKLRVTGGKVQLNLVKKDNKDNCGIQISDDTNIVDLSSPIQPGDYILKLESGTERESCILEARAGRLDGPVCQRLGVEVYNAKVVDEISFYRVFDPSSDLTEFGATDPKPPSSDRIKKSVNEIWKQAILRVEEVSVNEKDIEIEFDKNQNGMLEIGPSPDLPPKEELEKLENLVEGSTNPVVYIKGGIRQQFELLKDVVEVGSNCQLELKELPEKTLCDGDPIEVGPPNGPKTEYIIDRIMGNRLEIKGGKCKAHKKSVEKVFRKRKGFNRGSGKIIVITAEEVSENPEELFQAIAHELLHSKGIGNNLKDIVAEDNIMHYEPGIKNTLLRKRAVRHRFGKMACDDNGTDVDEQWDKIHE